MSPVFALEVTSTQVALLLIIVALLTISLFLAVAETALTRISRSKALSLLDEGRRGAAVLLQLVEHPERFLNPVLLVVLIAQLLQASLTGVLAEQLFGPWGVVASVFVNVAVVFVVAEAAPKTWAIQHPETAALISARPVAALVRFRPLRWMSKLLIGLTNWVLPGKGLKDGPYVSEEEILALAEVAVEEEVLDEGERLLIKSIIEFGDTVVREVMVPRPDMVAVPADFLVPDVMEVVILNGYSRLPAYGDSIDDIVGIVYAKDLMRAERDGKTDVAVSQLVRPARFVPETKRIAELLREMQAEQYHQAIVVDEYGGTSGLVTLEDLIEELVGEIVDEYDREEAMVEPLPDGDIRVNARLAIDELNELVKADLPEGDWDSVGGLMFHLLGHIPHEGETIEVAGFRLRADRVQGRRISRVRISRLDPIAEAEPRDRRGSASGDSDKPDATDARRKREHA